MKELQQILHILRTTTEPAVLASLVQADGSSYRKVGARLLWSPGTRHTGSISGGCLEEDLIERAREVHRSGINQTVVYDTTRENDLVWGVGLGCHGVVHVVLERVTGLAPHWATVAEEWRARRPVVLAISYGTDTATTPSTRFAFTTRGEVVGQAGNVEMVAHARSAMEAKQSAYRGQPDGTKVFFEYLPPPACLHVFGAGDDAIPLTRLAKELGWRVVVIDPRSAFVTPERFPLADELYIQQPEAANNLPLDDWTLGVIMTHHYRFDLPLLRVTLPRGYSYLGLLGPKLRAERILNELSQEGMTITDEMRQRLRAPVGLDLGGGSPEEVALSIVAEIQSVRNARDGRPLRRRTRPIHE